MRGILILNGQPYGGKIEKGEAKVYCCDGAYEWAKDKIKIDENVGDFDSLSYIPDPPPTEIFPSEKNFTDGEIAVKKLIEAGATEIEIYGGTGKRCDHFIGNLHLLYAARARGAAAKMISDNEIIFLGSGHIALDGYRGKTLSVLPFGGALHIMGSTGLKYSYPALIGYGECRGLSNIAESDCASLTIAEDDVALIIVNRGEV